MNPLSTGSTTGVGARVGTGCSTTGVGARVGTGCSTTGVGALVVRGYRSGDVEDGLGTARGVVVWFIVPAMQLMHVV